MNSIPFVVAKAIANGKIDLADFQESGRAQAAARTVASRIDYEFSPALSKVDGLEEATVEFILSNGSVVRKTVRVPLGHPERPLSRDQAIDKFRNNAALSDRPGLVAGADQIVERVLQIENEPDVAAFVGAMFGNNNDGAGR
jgi:2-methylcitrate dehydratase PrpD